MNELIKILGLQDDAPIDKIISALTQNKDKTQLFEKSEKELDPYQHGIFDPRIRQGKYVQREETNPDGTKREVRQWVEPNRLATPYQKLIVRKEKSFLFGNQPVLNANPKDEAEKTVLQAIERILHDIKEPSFNRKIAGSIASYTEGGELWWFKEGESHKSYGFKTNIKVKALCLSPKNNDLLFPYKDSLGDLLAFSRMYAVKEDGKDVQYCETYTNDKFYKFKREKSWNVVEGYPIENILSKIPVVLGETDQVAWYDVQYMIDRLEKLLSDHAEVNDRNAYPILAFKGKVKSFIEKGPGGAVELESGADMAYVSWDNATDSVKLEIENLVQNIQKFTQTPNISFDEVKSLGALSGTALKMLFLDAYLKVMELREIYDEYLQRRVNILKRIVGVINPSLKSAAENLIIEPEIIPFMVENEKEKIEIALLENGNKPLKSHQKSVMDFQGQDTEDFEQILKEERESQSLEYFNPTNVE